MDPLDRLSINSPSVDAQGDDQHKPASAGYGHSPHHRTDAPEGQTIGLPAARTQVRRDVFWNNVVREILMAMASAAAVSSGRLGTGPSAQSSSASPVDELFDGRVGVITTLGQRIPIADIIPVFACSMDGCDADKSRSNDVQCTVYRITTPTGESYTLPISQITGVHSLSEQLMNQLEEGAIDEDEDERGERVPFGFGAYTSLAKSEDEVVNLESSSPGGKSEGKGAKSED